MIKLVIINGYSGVGKDAFVGYCGESIKKFVRAYNFHHSDGAKDVLTRLGWDGRKTFYTRELLKKLVDFADTTDYNLKDFLGELKILNTTKKDYLVFYHAREKSFIDKLKREAEEKGLADVSTLLITRPTESVEPSCWYNIREKDYDRVIKNKGYLTELKALAEDYVKELEENTSWLK